VALEVITEVITLINPIFPTDALPSCVINQVDFNHWFKSGTVTKNGVVNPANSVTLGHKKQL